MSLMYDNMQDDLVTRKQLAKVATPEPMGARHFPYPFADFANEVVTALESRDYAIAEEEYAVTKNGNRCFALLAIHPSDITIPDEWNLNVGWRGAHDQEFARAITLGSRITVCSNLMFHGNLGVWQTRQTLNMKQRLPDMIDEAIGQLPAAAKELVVSFDKYRAKKVQQDIGYAMLVHMFKDDAFTAAQLGRAINEWDEPSFEDHAEDGFTAWRLLNAASQALKPTGTSGDFLVLQQRTQKVHTFMNDLIH